jgi:hypothetical protein
MLQGTTAASAATTTIASATGRKQMGHEKETKLE